MNNRGARCDKLRLFVALCAALLVARVGVPASADQPEAGAAFRRLVAGGDPWLAPESTSGHAWAFLPASSADSAPASDGYLIHLVPRQGATRTSAGSVRLVRPLRRSPLLIAGWRGEALLLMGPPGDGAAEPADRTVSAVRAVGPMSLGNWNYAPPERLELKGVVPPDALPRSMVGSELGPFLVIENAATHELQAAAIDDAGKWRPLRLPPGAPLTAQAGEVHALASASGLLVAL
ncbi:MAG: hypothetical protein K2X91_13005, partial [Thermoleophilia bacterium]|nr:hypothetical protein [Thermoleophilia bacterium]